MNVKQKQNDGFKNLLPYVVLAVVILVVISALGLQGSTVNELSTGELITELKENNVTVTIRREFGGTISAACGQLRSKREEI